MESLAACRRTSHSARAVEVFGRSAQTAVVEVEQATEVGLDGTSMAVLDASENTELLVAAVGYDSGANSHVEAVVVVEVDQEQQIRVPQGG